MIIELIQKRDNLFRITSLKLFYTTCIILFYPIFRNSKLLYFCSFHVCFSGPSKYTANDLRCSTKIYSLMWRTFIHINSFFRNISVLCIIDHVDNWRNIVYHHIIDFISKYCILQYVRKILVSAIYFSPCQANNRFKQYILQYFR